MKIKETKKEVIVFSKDTSSEWYRDTCFNGSFLRHTISYFKLVLEERGYLTLREVYEKLGIESKNVSWFAGWDLQFDSPEDFNAIVEEPNPNEWHITVDVHYFEED